MATKITRNIIESYLNCKYKGYLKLGGENGTPSDYEVMTAAARATSREQALTRLVARFGEGDACRGISVTAALLKQRAPILLDANLEDESLSLRFDLDFPDDLVFSAWRLRIFPRKSSVSDDFLPK
jgi:hypothetical protein